LSRGFHEGDENLEEMSWDEVRKHGDESAVWIVVDGYVIDATAWLDKHPGGKDIILKYAGRDATDQFYAFHRPRVAGRLEPMRIGRLAPDSAREHAPNPSTMAYRKLRSELWKTGMFKPSWSFYLAAHAIWISLLAAGIATLVYATPGWLSTIAAAVLVGFALQQAAFIGHDAAHYGVSSPKAGGGFNALSWFQVTVIFGASATMWTDDHSLHHAITMRAQEDPQFDYLPIWLVSEKELLVPGFVLSDIARVLVSVQHYTFLPFSIIGGRLLFHSVSAVSAIKGALFAPNAGLRFNYAMDALGLLMYGIWFSAVVNLVPTLTLRMVFVALCYATVGILHVQLLLSHVATDSLTPDEEESVGFFEFQMRTTRNITTDSWLEAWFHGGLEYQIEHHLFPQLPRHSLATVKPKVQQLCEETGVEYKSTGFWEAIGEILGHLKELAASVDKSE
jgi:delta8-fatty-acid desaturase